MKRLIVFVLACTLAVVTGCATLAPAHSITEPAPVAEKPKQEQPTPVVAKTSTLVKVFLVALNDNGKTGKKLDSGDSLVPVIKEITNPVTPLRGSLEALLSIKQRNYGESGLYNPLCSSNLKVDNITVQNGLAVIDLSGSLSLGGVLDIPRVKGQLTETALQFSTVKAVLIRVNGKKLDDALSLK